MADSPSDRRAEPERRGAADRRRGRGGPRGILLRLLHGERRRRADRRGGERRSAQQTAIDLVRSAFDHIAALRHDDPQLGDDARQRLDAALIRLRFAIERLEGAPRQE